MHDHAVWDTLLVKNRQDVLMSVPIVDYECFVIAFGHANVLTKGLVLGCLTVRAGAKVVETGLTDSAYAGLVGSQSLDLGERVAEPLAQNRRFVRMNRYGRDNLIEGVRRLDSEP